MGRLKYFEWVQFVEKVSRVELVEQLTEHEGVEDDGRVHVARRLALQTIAACHPVSKSIGQSVSQ